MSEQQQSPDAEPKTFVLVNGQTQVNEQWKYWVKSNKSPQDADKELQDAEGKLQRGEAQA